MKFFSLSAVCAVSVLCAGAAFAKLPAPDDAAKAKAAEAAAKAAWSGKVDGYQLCNAQDRAAAHFFAQAKAEGREVKPAVATPPCADPGLFTYTPPAPPEAKPLEAAGAHSPTTTAASPPSGTKTAAELAPAKK